MTSDVEALDVLILGGGMAGCVIAARLSEDPERSVCLVEAGPDYGPHDGGRWPEDMLDVKAIPWTHDWPPQGASPRSRARIIGGTSAQNAAMVVHPTPEDIDEWGRAGCAGWSYAGLEPHLRLAERTLGTRLPRPEELSAWHLAALEAAPRIGLPRREELNDYRQAEGIALIPLNAVDSIRWNAAFAYLDAARGRPNLEIRERALVDRVVIEDGRAKAALLREDDHEVEIAAGLIIVTAGAYGSPAILMRSGIGPPDELAELGIEPGRALPGVGSNLIDHPGARLFFQPSEHLSESLAEQERRGLLLEGAVIAKARTPAAPEGLWDLQLLPKVSANGEGGVEGRYEAQIGAFAIKPASRGRIRIATADPESSPILEQRELSDPDGADLTRLIDGIHIARRLAATPPLAELIAREVSPGPEVEGDDDLAAWLRENVRSYRHPVGTCRMGAAGDPGAVVDAHGEVHGLGGLYVADASIMPTIPRANTAITVLAIAERIASELRARGYKSAHR